ncbi:MAG: anaerobic ribonucleoside-triphosphate reductase [Spirochaetia bacterium]
MNQVKEIDARINDIKSKLAEVRGTKTEVYTRIVGYYRSVKNWNKGKREEYNHRVMFDPETQPTESTLASAPRIPEPPQKKINPDPDSVSQYAYFFRKTCPNCPPVKEYVEQLDMNGKFVDVDHEEGLKKAQELNVMGAPTVVFFNTSGKEVFRTQDLTSLKSFVSDTSRSFS